MFESIDIDYSWQAENLMSILPIMLALVFFVLSWFTTHSPTIKAYFYEKYEFDKASFKHIFFTKIFGFFSMGVMPVIICLIFLGQIPFSDYGLTIIPETSGLSLVWTIVLSIIVVPLTYINAKKPKHMLNYPQIRSKFWTRRMMAMNLLGWFLYLFGYEFLFRGVLFIPVVEALGVWPAIAINIALYSATHIPKGLEETIGAVPLGFVLCLLTLSTGTIWIAFLVHVIMAWTLTLTSFKYSSEMKYVK